MTTELELTTTKQQCLEKPEDTFKNGLLRTTTLGISVKVGMGEGIGVKLGHGPRVQVGSRVVVGVGAIVAVAIFVWHRLERPIHLW